MIRTNSTQHCGALSHRLQPSAPDSQEFLDKTAAGRDHSQIIPHKTGWCCSKKKSWKVSELFNHWLLSNVDLNYSRVLICSLISSCAWGQSGLKRHDAFDPWQCECCFSTENNPISLHDQKEYRFINFYSQISAVGGAAATRQVRMSDAWWSWHTPTRYPGPAWHAPAWSWSRPSWTLPPPPPWSGCWSESPRTWSHSWKV